MRRNATVESRRSEEVAPASDVGSEGAFPQHVAVPGISNQASLGLFRASSLPNLHSPDMAVASPENVARPRAASLESLHSSELFQLTPAQSRDAVVPRGPQSGRESMIYTAIFYLLTLLVFFPNLFASLSAGAAGGAEDWEGYGNNTAPDAAGWLNTTALAPNGTMGMADSGEAMVGPLVVVPGTMAAMGLLMDAWGLARTRTLHSGRALKNFVHLPPAVTLKIMGTMLGLGFSFGLRRVFPSPAVDTMQAFKSVSAREVASFVINNSKNFVAFEIARGMNRLWPTQTFEAKKEHHVASIVYHFIRSFVVYCIVTILQQQKMMKPDPFAPDNIVANMLLSAITEGMVDSALVSHGYGERVKGKAAGQGILEQASRAFGHPSWTKKPNNYKHETRNPKLMGADEKALWTLTSGASSDVMVIKTFVNIISYVVWSVMRQKGSTVGAVVTTNIGSNIVAGLLSAKRVIEIGGVDFGMPHILRIYRALKSQLSARGIHLDEQLVVQAVARHGVEPGVEEAMLGGEGAEPKAGEQGMSAQIRPRRFSV